MFEWKTWIGLGVAGGIALVAAVFVMVLASVVVRVASRHREWGRILSSRARHPFRLLLVLAGFWTAFTFCWPVTAYKHSINHAFLIAVIVVSTWFLAALVGFVLAMAMGYYRIDVPDNRLRRRLRTQLIIVRRLAAVVIVIVGLASVLLTFPGVQAVGTSVLASAGVVSIIAGLAAQSTLANVFAGCSSPSTTRSGWMTWSSSIRSGVGSRRSPSPTWSCTSGTTAAWCCHRPTSRPPRSRTGQGTRASFSGRSTSTWTGGSVRR